MLSKRASAASRGPTMWRVLIFLVGGAAFAASETIEVRVKANDWNTAYSGTISVGKPAQSFTVTFTTLNDKTWVPGKNGYDEAKSETSVRSDTPFNVGYIVGDAAGFYVEETFAYTNDGTDMKVPGKVLVGVSNDVSGGYDGLLGLGLPERVDPPGSHKDDMPGNWKSGQLRIRSRIALDTPDVVSVIKHTIESGVLDRPIVSVYLRKCVGGCKDGGIVAFGKEIRNKCGEVKSWIPSKPNNDSHWMFDVEEASLGSAVHSEKQEAVTSIGTSIIIMPRDVAQKFAAEIGAHENGNSYFVKCDQQFEMKLKINGVEYTIPGEQLKMGKGETCQFLIQDASESGNFPKWVLGQPFARAYCEIHDYEKRQMGIADVLKPKKGNIFS